VAGCCEYGDEPSGFGNTELVKLFSLCIVVMSVENGFMGSSTYNFHLQWIYFVIAYL
jgi:hypothetical protein